MAGRDEPATDTRRVHIALSPLERARLWVEIVALLAAGVWAIYTFVYQTQIAPLLEPAHATVANDVARVGVTASSYVERGQVTVTNDGHASLDVAAIAINLFALREAVAPRFKQAKLDGAVVSESYSSFPEGELSLVASNGALYAGAASGPPGSHLILHPGDAVHIDLPAIVARDRYAALLLSTKLIYVRYPFRHAVPIALARDKSGAATLSTSVGLESAFPVEFTSFFGV